MSQPFAIEVTAVGQLPVIRLRGALDLHTAPDLCAAIDRLRSEGECDIVVDLTEVGFCDSRGLSALFHEDRESVIAKCRLFVVLPEHPSARRVFELTCADDVLALYPSPAAAVAAA